MKPTQNRIWLGVIVIALSAMVACQSPEPADPSISAEVVEVITGQGLYERYCQSCHGPEGRADGPVAELLRIKPPDLALIAERAQGPFPVDEVAAYIDGRRALEGHNSRQMPVWGNIWTDTDGGADAEQEIARQIDMLVEYIRTLQEDIPGY